MHGASTSCNKKYWNNQIHTVRDELITLRHMVNCSMYVPLSDDMYCPRNFSFGHSHNYVLYDAIATTIWPRHCCYVTYRNRISCNNFNNNFNIFCEPDFCTKRVLQLVLKTKMVVYLLLQSEPGAMSSCPGNKTCLVEPCTDTPTDHILYCHCPPDTYTYNEGANDASYCRRKSY